MTFSLYMQGVVVINVVSNHKLSVEIYDQIIKREVRR